MTEKAPVLVQFNTSIEEAQAFVVVVVEEVEARDMPPERNSHRKRGIWLVDGCVRMCKEGQDWVEMIRNV